MFEGAVLEGGCDPVFNAKIRARYDPKLMKAALDANGKVISNYFTHEESVVVGGIVIWKELVARDANGNEIGSTFNMDSVKTITFTTVLDLQSGVQLPPKSVQVYLGAADNNAAYTAINPYIDRVVQSGQSFNDVLNPNDPLIVNYRYFHIVGDLELPYIPTNPSTGTTTYSLQDFHLRMDSGNNIHVEPDVLLRLDNTDLAGCATFWQGIELDEGASLEAKSSNVADAQYGIRSTGRTRLEVRNCTFDNNNTGIRIAVPPGYYQPNLVLLGNTFDNSAPLKTAYSGQSPAPAARGYAGICVEGVNAVNISGLPGTGSVTSSRFRNLLNGVVALRSNVSVTQLLFENIQRAALPSGYPLAVSGKGIYASGGRLVVQGALISGGLHVEFDSCHTAIQAQAAAMDAVECTMTRVHNGIVAGGGADRPYRVAWNDIEAIDRGISVHYQFGLPGRASIDNNTVTMSGNAQAVAIATGGTDLLQQWGGYLGNNVVTLDAGATGILIGAGAGPCGSTRRAASRRTLDAVRFVRAGSTGSRL